MKRIDVKFVSSTIQAYLDHGSVPLIYDDPANGQRVQIEAGAAGAADGLLPAILVAGESVWRNLTGKGFELELARDPTALLGYHVRGIGGPSFSIVILASFEALAQVRRSEGMIVNEFNALWAAAGNRAQLTVACSETPGSGARP